MPVFNSPIITDDRNLPKITGQKLPVLLYLYDRDDPQLIDGLNRIARDHAGKLLVTKVNTRENPQTYNRYRSPALPAILALKEGLVQSSAESVHSVNVIASHVAYLLGEGPKPAEPEVNESAHPFVVTDSTFERDVIRSDVPVLVDFWATWCGPCRTIEPIVAQIARNYAGRIKVAKLNVDENQRTVSQYRAMSIPTLIMFKGGKPVNQLVGAHPMGTIQRMVEDAL